jgi:hypothetical protein
MFKIMLVAEKKNLRTSFGAIFLMAFLILAEGCNSELKPNCQHQLLAQNETAAFIDIGQVPPYFLKTDTSKHIKSRQLYSQISSLVKQQKIEPNKCAIQWGQTQNNEIVVFVGTDDNSAINKIFCSLVDKKKEFFKEVENVDSCKLIFLFTSLTWAKDNDGFDLPYIKGEVKGLKEI